MLAPQATQVLALAQYGPERRALNGRAERLQWLGHLDATVEVCAAPARNGHGLQPRALVLAWFPAVLLVLFPDLLRFGGAQCALEHLEEKVRTWEHALPEQLRAVGLRDEQAAAVPHAALDDVPAQRVVLPRG